MTRDKQRTIAKRLTAAVLSLITVLSLLPWDGGLTAYAADTSSPIALTRLSGSGEAFIYHSFAETTNFTAGMTYAFLDGIYSATDAVSALGAGAILEVLDSAPVHGGKWDTDYYIRKKYGDSAAAKVYVAVVTPGKDFDTCPKGGLYQVPGTSNPTEYRYFCWKGGAYNCGPYYAYTYVQESITYDKVSASLKSIENQGSTDPEDYTVSITYNGNLPTMLDPGSYTVKFTAPDTVTFTISDSVGNSVTANFQSPLAVRYDGNAEGVSGVPDTQSVWSGNSVILSATKPTRAGYTLASWKDKATGTTYSAGATISPTASLNLLAQWKDTQKPTVAYSPTQVMTGDSDDAVQAAVQAALTITDNEPVSGCTTAITLPANCTKTPGNKSVTVKVKDKAGNTTTLTCAVYVNSYVSFGKPVFTENTSQLTATLTNPGTDTVTESGFVWGVMNSPTLTVNNGTAETASVVSTAGGSISVKASDLQKGVTYYARAYITAGGITYYSEEISFGLGLPAYGTFTIKNNGNNTFTITRSDGSEGTQNVTYRTVNGSAVGGTHFKHQVVTLAFEGGETSKTITITEYGANTAYDGKPATAYSNANRTYSVELYRVTGGGSLGTTTSATRTMTNSSSYTIDRTIYSNEKSYYHFGQTTDGEKSGRQIADATNKQGATNGNVNFVTSRYGTNYSTSTSLSTYYSGNPLTYLQNTCENWLYRYEMYAYEQDDGWEHAFIGTSALGSTFYNVGTSGNAVSGVSGQLWACTFQQAKGKEHKKYSFPSTQTGGGESDGYPYRSNGNTTTVKDIYYVKPGVNQSCYLYFSACGANEDVWWINWLQSYALPCDEKEPQLVAVAPMAKAWYKPGDKFVVSLIFDEIVDGTNSTLKNVSVSTLWGTAKYTGGADTNVLYFTGTIAENATNTTLKVNSIEKAECIKDMCSTAGTATSSTVSETAANAELKTGKPSFTVTPNGITNGTGKATIKVNGTQTYTTDMSYAWSDSITVPASEWVKLSEAELNIAKSASGLTLSIRKAAGSGANNGKWYLHVKGVYGDTGYTVYKTATLDFGTAASPASGSTPPSLTVTVDNANWATSRVIKYSYTPTTGTLQYRTPGSTTWTTSKSTTQASFTQNGYYTFKLTAGDETIIKTVLVERIDRTAPTASVGEPTAASVESPKKGVYTKLVLPVTYSDAGSGVKTVKYALTNSAATPTSSSWIDLNKTLNTVTYPATETTPTKKYLHIRVTDNVLKTYDTCSEPYTVMAASAIASYTPTITLTGNPTAWQNDTATLEWKLTNYTGKNYEVTLPNGKTSKDTGGEIWARQNGTYTVTVRDLDYGGENSATVTVTKLDFDPPDVTVSGIASGWSTDYSQTMTVNAADRQSGVGKKWYKIVSSAEESPTEGLTEFTSEITVSDEGSYYIYWKVCDNAGNDSDDIKREGNYTEGFQPVQIDKTPPAIAFGEYTADKGLPVTASDETSKLASVTYSVFNSITKKATTGTVSNVSGLGSKTFAVPADMLLPGDNTVTVTAYDNAGKSMTQMTTVHVTVISVDITWGAMAFTYSDGTWMPEKHDYDGRGWTADSPDGDRITVKNSGEESVSVTYSYTPEVREVTGSFTDGENAAITAPVTLPVNETQSAQLCLSGKPGKTLNSEKIGSVTVTIGGE